VVDPESPRGAHHRRWRAKRCATLCNTLGVRNIDMAGEVERKARKSQHDFRLAGDHVSSSTNAAGSREPREGVIANILSLSSSAIAACLPSFHAWLADVSASTLPSRQGGEWRVNCILW